MCVPPPLESFHTLLDLFANVPADDPGLFYGGIPLRPEPFPTGKERSKHIAAAKNGYATLADHTQMVSIRTTSVFVATAADEVDLCRRTPGLSHFCYGFSIHDPHPTHLVLYFHANQTNQFLNEATLQRLIPPEYYVPSRAPKAQARPVTNHTSPFAASIRDGLPGYLRQSPLKAAMASATSDAMSVDSATSTMDTSKAKRPRASSPAVVVPSPPGMPPPEWQLAQPPAIQRLSTTALTLDLGDPWRAPVRPVLFSHLPLSWLYDPNAKNFVSQAYSITQSSSAISGFEAARSTVKTRFPEHYCPFIHILMDVMKEGASPSELNRRFQVFMQEVAPHYDSVTGTYSRRNTGGASDPSASSPSA